MRPGDFFVLVALWAASPSPVAANFNIYIQLSEEWFDGGDGAGWLAKTQFKVFQDDSSPHDAKEVFEETKTWARKSDVSGGKLGVRCKGKGCVSGTNADIEDIEELEMNFKGDPPSMHWSKGQAMRAADRRPPLLSGSEPC
jgi:hypothetical protein